ncbi:isochorismate synthase MenF [Paracoccus sp. S1E-3]|uniref:isochorismate synthase n=1 Tax=Paracoccus sp. S1E-3 TaxID=2756130 RepID=UPI0015EFB97F|nr:isochorismate synthase [Paracoccus sp. S1E-3]MBA4489247.1 isochorismate synthase [Paracoccus sp. S1E-3]
MIQNSDDMSCAQDCEPTIFSFSGPSGQIHGRGAGQPVPRGSADTLESRLPVIGAGDRCLIGGALPFSRQDHDYLWQARQVSRHAPAREVAAPPDLAYRDIRAEPSPTLYAASVAHALRIMDRSEPALSKVVLARTLAVEADGPIPQDGTFRRIAEDQSVTAFRVMLPDDPRHGGWTGRALIGATPELLIDKAGARISSHPLAGSARRQADPELDRLARERLQASEKDRREHAIVVEYILDTLAPYCTRLTCPEGTVITGTRSMWHLGTRIEGSLRDPAHPAVLLAAMLHPTPAVCGMPCARAAGLIQQLEPVERAFYAGAVGWCDLGAGGDGSWYVAIRCADICGPYARLYAGAGIVPGSEPAAEAAETGAKFGAMLQVLGLPGDTGMPPATSEF